MEGLLFTRQHTGVYIHPLIQLIFIEYPLCDRTGLGFHGTVWIKQCFCCPRTFQEEQRENRQINMKQIRWWLRLQIRKWNKGPESDPVKHAVLMKPSRNTAEAQKHVQLIASLQPHELTVAHQAPRLWDFQGKSTGVGSHLIDPDKSKTSSSGCPNPNKNRTVQTTSVATYSLPGDWLTAPYSSHLLEKNHQDAQSQNYPHILTVSSS